MSDSEGSKKGKNKKSPRKKHKKTKKKTGKLNKEEEYRQMNAELEAKTASLVKEADEALKSKDKLLSKPVSRLGHLKAEDFFDDLPQTRDGSSREATKSKKTSQLKSEIAIEERAKGATHKRTVSGPKVMDTTFTSAVYAIENRLQEEYEKRGGDNTDLNLDDDDIFPEGASNMSKQAIGWFLKARLRIMKEELEKMAAENKAKDEQRKILEMKLKQLKEENATLSKTKSAQQSQIEKQRKLADDAVGKTEHLQAQATVLKRELDVLKRDQKQATTSLSATDVRLNRALEEAEKYKSELQRTKTMFKENLEQERKKADRLTAENSKLEKVNSDLISAYKKQMKLVNVLKKQKILLESSRLLAFSEEEFVKAIDWGKELLQS